MFFFFISSQVIHLLLLISFLKFFFRFLLIDIIIVTSSQVESYDVKCDQTFPSYCFIGAAIDLPLGDELIIAPLDHAHLVTRFEIAPVSNLKIFPKQVFQSFPHLEAVTLNSANIRSLATNTFENATNLKDLHLKLNKLTKLSKSIFKNAVKLQQLDLSGNEISVIEDDAFNGLKQLRTLKLNGNQLKILKTRTFIDLDNLEYLHLYSNRLETIESGALNLPQLTEAFFGNNRLRVLPDDLFNNTPKLEVTELSSNRLIRIGDAFNDCHKIYSLNLESNEIKDIDLKKFAKMQSLSSLSLNNTNFHFPDELPTAENITVTSSSLESLNLGNNNLTNPDIFQHLIMFPELQRLYLYNNNFHSFDAANDIKQILPKLNTLDLIGNKLIVEWIRHNYDILRRDQINVLIPRK